MRVIFKIARAELRNLFYSPVAWIVFIIFFIATELLFILQLPFFVDLQDYLRATQPNWKNWGMSLTDKLYSTIYEAVISYLYFFIPLLTMGVVNREVNSGSIKLLYSSPIGVNKIIFGKFLGLLSYLALLVAGIGALMLIGYFAIENVEYKIFFSSLLGIYLLASAYISIGLFISCLTSYQIVAGVLTFIVLLILHMAGGIWQQYDFVRDITYFLSISGRIDKLVSGLMSSKDIIYFLLIIALFISFSIIKLRSIQQSSSWKGTTFRYLMVFILVIFAGYFSSRPGYIAYLDLSANKVNTILPITQQALLELGDDPLKVTLYTNILDHSTGTHGFPKNRNKYLWDFWERYTRFHPNIKMEYVYYYDIMDADSNAYKSQYPDKTIEAIAKEIMKVEKLPESIFKTPAEIRSLINLEDEGKRLVMQLEYKGKKTFLRTYVGANTWPSEMHISAAVGRLTRDRFPLILFTTSHFERSPYKSGETEYATSTLRKLSEIALINTAADVDTINLQNDNIPDSLDALVVADPRSAFTQEEQDKISQYIDEGGNVIFFGEPDKQAILNPILNKLGINLQNGTIVNPGPNEMPNVLSSNITAVGIEMAKEPFLYEMKLDPLQNREIKMVGAASIQNMLLDKFKIAPIFDIPGNESRWLENGILVVDSAAPEYNDEQRDIKLQKYVTGVAMVRSINGKQQRIVVTGDADFMSNLRNAGLPFSNAAYSWMLNNEFPKYTNRPYAKDMLLRVDADTAYSIQTLFLYGIPGFMLVLGIIILIRRNKR